MSSFDEYKNRYKTARMERRSGVLQVTLHTDGQSLRWGFLPHGELPEAFLALFEKPEAPLAPDRR